MNTDIVKNWAWPCEGGVFETTLPVGSGKLSKVARAQCLARSPLPRSLAAEEGSTVLQVNLKAVSGNTYGTSVVSEGHPSDGMQRPSIDGTKQLNTPSRN